MLQPAEIIEIETAKIACDGDEFSPHPRVYLTVGAENFVDCPYCGRHFVRKAGSHGGDAH